MTRKGVSDLTVLIRFIKFSLSYKKWQESGNQLSASGLHSYVIWKSLAGEYIHIQQKDLRFSAEQPGEPRCLSSEGRSSHMLLEHSAGDQFT